MMERLGVLIFLICFGLGASIQMYYMDQNCGKILDFSTKGLYQIRIRYTRYSTYRANADCDFILKTGASERFMVYFQSVQTTSCSHAYIDVYNGNNTASSSGLIISKCGYHMSSSSVYTTTGNSMWLNFYSDSYAYVDKGFDMIVTSYHTGSCYSYEYECENDRCIYDSLRCNGYNPCGDNSDCPLSGGAIAGIVIGCFFFIVIVATVSVICRRRSRRRYTKTIVTETTSYGSAGYGYNQPPPPAYPTGQQYPPQGSAPPPPQYSAPYPQTGPAQYPQN